MIAWTDAPGADAIEDAFASGTANVIVYGGALVALCVVAYVIDLGVKYLWRAMAGGGEAAVASNYTAADLEPVYFSNGQGDYMWTSAYDRDWADGTEWFEVDEDEFEANTR